MMRITPILTAFSIALFGNIALVGIGATKEKVVCRDCPFPMKVSCKAAEQPQGGGADPFPFKCNIAQKPGFRPIKTLQCEANAGVDPFPFKCAIQY